MSGVSTSVWNFGYVVACVMSSTVLNSIGWRNCFRICALPILAVIFMVFCMKAMYCYGTELKAFADGKVVFETKCNISARAKVPIVRFTVKYTVTADGAVLHEVDAAVREDAPFLPRFGVEYVLTSGSEDVNYYGMGPGENYVDLHAHAHMGWFNMGRKIPPAVVP